VSFSVRSALTNSTTEFSVLSAPRLYNATLGIFATSRDQSVERLQVVKIVKPRPGLFTWPSVGAPRHCTALGSKLPAPYIEVKEKQRRGLQLTPCVPGRTASVET
jgi:hypothetical protein